jgi:hypothetical protein
MPYLPARQGKRLSRRRVNSMSSNQRDRGPVTIELVVAGAVMILSGAAVAELALIAPAGSSVSLTPASLLILLLALVLAASGIESIRRRHFLYAVLVPAALALVNLGYVIQTGQAAAIVSVLIFVVVVALVASRRSDFT